MYRNRYLVGVFTLVFPLLSIGAEEHHNLRVVGCRSIPSGDLQIRGVSATDNAERHLTYNTQMFSEKILDRYLSICLTAFSSGTTLRTDYLECTGTTCSPKSGTTAFLMK